MHSSLPRSNRHATNSSHIVPDNGSTPSQAPSGPTPSGGSKSKGSSTTSMLDKFKLFGTKNRADKENPPAAADDADTAPKNGHQAAAAVDGSSVTTPGDSRVHKPPVRGHRDTGTSQQQAPLTAAGQLHTHSSNADALATLPPGGARSNPAASASHHASNSSISTPSKISKVGLFTYVAGCWHNAKRSHSSVASYKNNDSRGSVR